MTASKKYSAANDFRSDTFTTPTASMLQAALSASVGDAVYNEDHDTIALETRIARLTGKSAGLYCVSGTLSNQIAVRTHLHQPPYSVLCDYRSHIYVHEAAGLSTLSNAMVTPVRPSNGNYLTLEDIKKHIIPEDGDIHGAPTKLISLENTLHGIIFPYDELKKISEFCRENDYPLHCDGARLWNAHVETGISFKEYGDLFDTISICLSKSIGAPIGSVLVGSSQFIKKANHFRKQNGGGVRQSGLLASMAQVAIDENLPKIQSTHEKAKDLARFLQEKGLKLESPVDTNFVFIDYTKTAIDDEALDKFAEKYNVKLMGNRVSFHYQIEDSSIENCKKAIWEAYQYTIEHNDGLAPEKQLKKFKYAVKESDQLL